MWYMPSGFICSATLFCRESKPNRCFGFIVDEPVLSFAGLSMVSGCSDRHSTETRTVPFGTVMENLCQGANMFNVVQILKHGSGSGKHPKFWRTAC